MTRSLIKVNLRMMRTQRHDVYQPNTARNEEEDRMLEDNSENLNNKMKERDKGVIMDHRSEVNIEERKRNLIKNRMKIHR